MNWYNDPKYKGVHSSTGIKLKSENVMSYCFFLLHCESEVIASVSIQYPIKGYIWRIKIHVLTPTVFTNAELSNLKYLCARTQKKYGKLPLSGDTYFISRWQLDWYSDFIIQNNTTCNISSPLFNYSFSVLNMSLRMYTSMVGIYISMVRNMIITVDD